MTKQDLADELMDILNEFVEEEEETIDRVFKSVAQETQQMVSEKSPGDGDYASGWEVKAERVGFQGGTVQYTVCNPKHYRLTHLLEKGHQSKNQFGGPYKRVKAIRHIRPSEQWGNKRLVERLKDEL